MSFTIDILSFYPYQIQPRMRDLDFFPPTILPVPSALLPENPSRLEGRMEAYRQGLRGKTSQGCCWEGKELECRVTLSSISPFTQSIPIPEIHTRLSIYQDKASSSTYKDVLVIGKLLPPSLESLSLGKQFCAVLEFNSETTVQI